MKIAQQAPALPPGHARQFAGNERSEVAPATMLPFAVLMDSHSGQSDTGGTSTGHGHQAAANASSAAPRSLLPMPAHAPRLHAVPQAKAGEGPATEAAAIQPRIGEEARPFVAGALLVNTALQPREASLPTPQAASGCRTVISPPPDGRWREMPGGTAAPLVPEAPLAGVADVTASEPQPGLPAYSGPAVTRGAGTPPNSAPAAIPAPNPVSRGVTPSSRTATKEPASETPARIHTPSIRTGNPAPPPEAGGACSAQLVWAEGGLRVVLRLPRLPGEMRAELETRLQQLLRGFGHFRHEFLIRHSGEI